jgi:hypothetical protein
MTNALNSGFNSEIADIVLSIIGRSEKSIGAEGPAARQHGLPLTAPSPGRSSGWTTAKFFLDTIDDWAALPEPIGRIP